MNKQTQKISLVIFLFCLALPLCFAWVPTGSDTGSVSIGPGSGGTIVVNPEEPTCNEIWDLTWSECISNSQTAYCNQLTNCQTENTKPADCGKTRTCGTTDTGTSDDGGSSGGGGGGGGGSTYTNTGTTTDCAENWECSDWGVCSSKIQKRSCSDANNCKTTDLKPLLERECSVEGASGDEGIGLGKGKSTSSGFFGGITGAVIGGLSSPRVFVPLIFVVLILGATIFIIFKRKKAPTSEAN